METGARQRGARGVVLDVIVSAVVPVIVFQVARRLGAAEVPSLAYAAVIPAVVAVAGLVRRRTLDPIAAIVLVGLALSGLGFALGGGPRIILIRESFLTGALGIACLFSLVAWPRPLMFYFGRYFATQGDPVAAARYDALWSRPGFRTVNRTITLVWAAAYLGEFALRVAISLTLPIVVALAAGPLVLAAITAGTIAWTFAYVRRARRRAVAAGVTEIEAALGEDAHPQAV